MATTRATRACRMTAAAMLMLLLAPWPGARGRVAAQPIARPAGALVVHDERTNAEALRPVHRPAGSDPSPPPAAARAPKRRDGFVAGLLGAAVPGLGHVYAGEPWRGLAVFLVTETALVTGLKCDNRYGAGAAGAVGFAGYLYGIVDAPAAADRFNRRHRLGAIQ